MSRYSLTEVDPAQPAGISCRYYWPTSPLGQVFEDVAQFEDCGSDPGSPPFPIAVLTSEKCRDAFLSAVTPTGHEAPKWHFEDLDSAIEFCESAVQEWLDS